MMASLRGRLFVFLLAATSAIWLCAVIWIWFGTRAELEHVLDTRLQEAARMVHSLVSSGNMAQATAPVQTDDSGYTRQLSCQIWSMDGRLLARSSGAPEASLAPAGGGFADRTINDETWRVYTIVDTAKEVRVAVGDRVGLRDRLVRDLIIGLIAPALLIAPLLGLMIWIGLGRGLAPLNRIASDITNRDGDDMSPVSAHNAPSEARPLIIALNSLFEKVKAARHHERDITAFAAHELRTPLAGLKTQAQVALAARDDAVRDGALQQILVSVERSSRLIRQLLSLAKLEAMAQRTPDTTVNAGAVLREVIAQSPAPDGVDIAIDPELDQLSLRCEFESLHLVLRNLHENAIEHSHTSGRVTWHALADGHGLSVDDDGPGIPPEEIAFVTQRFYRGRNKVGSGSGLGLTIAAMAASRFGGELAFSNRANRGGLRCTLTWGPHPVPSPSSLRRG